MPQPRYINTEEMKSPNRAQENLERFFSNVSKEYGDRKGQQELAPIWEQYSKQEKDYLETRAAIEKSNKLSPTQRLQATQSLNDTEKLLIEREKAINSKINKGILTQEEKVRQKGNLVKAGYPEEIADFYLDSPPGVQGILAREHKELVERGIRSPLVKVPEGVDQGIPGEPVVDQNKKPVFVDDPITPKEKKDASKSEPIPEEEWPAPEVPKLVNYNQRVAWENENQKVNGKALKETTEAKKILTNNNNRIKTMTEINDGKYLPDGLGRLITIDPKTGDVRPTAALAKQQNPQTALYVKNLNQYLEGIKAQLGSVISDFDIRTFKSQLPSLLNDEQGRRLILKQMQYTNELESVYNNAMNEALKHYGRNADEIQISKVVADKVASKEEDLIGKINNLVKASDFINIKAENPEKFRGTTLMQTPKGEFRAVPNEKVESLKAKNWRDF